MHHTGTGRANESDIKGAGVTDGNNILIVLEYLAGVVVVLIAVAITVTDELVKRTKEQTNKKYKYKYNVIK